MAGKSKKSKQYNDSNKYNESKMLTKTTKFKFNTGDQVIYIGGVYLQYKNCAGTIVKCSSKIRIDYSVQFEDGNIVKCLLESALTLAEDTNQTLDEVAEVLYEN